MIFLLMPLIMACEAKWFRKAPVVLNIKNDLGWHTDLTVHCKSKNDDLGVHLVPYLGKYSFRFRPNFFGTTLYFCRFSWRTESHSFDIFDSGRSSETVCRGGGDCNWSIRADAAYWLDPGSEHNGIKVTWV